MLKCEILSETIYAHEIYFTAAFTWQDIVHESRFCLDNIPLTILLLLK